jgi:uncharacterized SAM-binding protein YcdF (DUF218 family)
LVAGLVTALVLLAMAAQLPSVHSPAYRLAQTFLEGRFQRTAIKPEEAITGIVVLGGRVERTHEAIRLARLFPGATLILSGPGGSEIDAVEAARLVANRVVIERQATNTFGNAIHSKVVASPRPGQRWLLVTSALHMARAKGAFDAVQFPVEPWPVYDTEVLVQIAAPAIRHELVGLIAYRLMSRTRSLFPSASGDMYGATGGVMAAPPTSRLSELGES